MSNASRQAEKNQVKSGDTVLMNGKPVMAGAVKDGAPELVHLVPAAFTERELFQLRNACRDSDNENALRFLEAALARAGGKS